MNAHTPSMLQSRPRGPHETFELSIDPKGVNPAVPAQQDYPCAFPASRLGPEASVLSASSGCPGAAGGFVPHLHQQGFPFSLVPSHPDPWLARALVAQLPMRAIRSNTRSRVSALLRLGERHDPAPSHGNLERLAGARCVIRRTMSGNGGWRPPTVCGEAGLPRWQHGSTSPSKGISICNSYLFAHRVRSLDQRNPRPLGASLLFAHQSKRSATRDDAYVLDTLVAMQRHADYIGRHGYHWWTSGKIAMDHAHHLRRKFAGLYGIDLHRNTRSRHKKSGIGAATLLIYRIPDSVDSAGHDESTDQTLGWTLLVTDGRHPAFHRESLKDAYSVDGRFGIGPYELIRAPRRGQTRIVWTFRMQQSYYDNYRQRVIRSARGDPREPTSQVLRDLYAEPGWRPIRSAVGRIVALYRREWRRRRGRHDAFPKLPRLGYVQRFANQHRECSPTRASRT